MTDFEPPAHYCSFLKDQVGRRNIEKLRNRYPEGFSAERSINRVAE